MSMKECENYYKQKYGTNTNEQYHNDEMTEIKYDPATKNVKPIEKPQINILQ